MLQTKVLTTHLTDNLQVFRNHFHNTEDLKIEILQLDHMTGYLLYFETVVERKILEETIKKPIVHNSVNLDQLTSFITKTSAIPELEIELLEGNCLLLIEGSNLGYIYHTKSVNFRNIEEPNTEQVIRGSHEGFNESIATNIFLIRKRIKSPNLQISYFDLGTESKTKIALISIKGIASEHLITQVKEKIKAIKTDFIHAPGHLEEFLENKYSIFPQMLSTERPDRTVANLLDGRIALIADNSPGALILPVTFFTFFQSPEDYNNRWYYGSFIRMIRIISFVISILLPAFYISIVSFHYEVVPVEIVTSIKSSLEYVPYPPLIEALAMQVTLELLREASIRLPSPIAQTIGVVGGLVIGTAVVEANLVSNTMIIVVAITAIASFIVPIHEMGSSLRLLGFPFMIFASIFGFIGMSFIFMILLIHLCKLESFGTPYLSPYSTLRWKEMGDTILRIPLPFFTKRPSDAQPTSKARWRGNRDE
ncbi:MAG: spore germination protein [Bacillaceae bacterium]|nr:spore germination protein [Bacillaceae bacterium]